MKLSDLKCRKAKAEEKLIKLSDGDGLFLHVEWISDGGLPFP